MKYNISYVLLNTETENVITITHRDNPIEFYRVDAKVSQVLHSYNNTKFKLESIQINASKDGKNGSGQIACASNIETREGSDLP